MTMTVRADSFHFNFRDARLEALSSGALWWQDQRMLVVSDLHLGRSERIARRSGYLIPPYDTQDTLGRLAVDIQRTEPRMVVCLGDSVDDLPAAALPEKELRWLNRLMSGRRWVWIEGNHDPGPLGLGGEHHSSLIVDSLVFRHVAESNPTGEVSGHYHPKIRIAGQSRRAFLTDNARVMLPAYGAYTGGLDAGHPDLRPLFEKQALAILTGRVARPVPF